MFGMIGRAKRRLFTWLGVKAPPVVAVLRLEGVIESKKGIRGGLALNAVADRLTSAFATPRLSALVLEINSPGGSPVQSALIFERIRDLARKKDVPVLAFCEDIAASGGYILALSADEIYAHEASIIGSIGVVSGGFGFHKLMEKLGIERRLYTAGSKKVTLDMFNEENEEGVARLKALQEDMHDWFKTLVRKRRGKRLSGDEETLFSGDVFLGQDAADRGLVDDCTAMIPFLEERFGDNIVIKRFGEKKPRLSGLLGLMSDQTSPGADVATFVKGDGWAESLISSLEERSYWSRFGL